jgi:hypothetical protein
MCKSKLSEILLHPIIGDFEAAYCREGAHAGFAEQAGTAPRACCLLLAIRLHSAGNKVRTLTWVRDG